MDATGASGTPNWVGRDVLPKVEGHVRAVHMLSDSQAIVFGEQYALLAEKRLVGGVRTLRVDFPAGFLINGSRCPHCNEIIAQPVGKVARLAAGAPKGKGLKATR